MAVSYTHLDVYKRQVLDPACGSGGMFVSSSDFVNAEGINANSVMTFYGQEKVEFNAKLCICLLYTS